MISDPYDGGFVEQIEPGAFGRAIDNAVEPIELKVNHTKVIGDTDGVLSLNEDSIGLYARAEVTDAEVIDKAAEGKLRGWSFGFVPLSEATEQTYSGTTRRIVKEMDLKEVSIIDDTVYPAYAGTSIKSSADDTKADEPKETSEDAEEGKEDRSLRIVYRALGTDFELVDRRTAPEAPDYSYYEQINKIYGGKKNEA